MTVAVSVNVSDGVVLAVDSAVSVQTSQGLKIYEDAEKLFPLSERPIGVAIYGLGAIGTRSIGGHLREFEVTDPAGVVSGASSVSDVVEQLRAFFSAKYQNEVVPQLEAALGKPFAQMTPAEIPGLGLVVGGFSAGSYLSEVWEIIIPTNSAANSADQKHAAGAFGASFFASFEPIRRYVFGADQAVVAAIVAQFLAREGRAQLDPGEVTAIHQILTNAMYQIPFNAMPIDQAVAYARFLVDLVINHHRYTLGPSVVGGTCRVGKVSYRGGRFELLG